MFFLSDYCHWLPLSGTVQGCSRTFVLGCRSFISLLACPVMVLLLILFGLLQVPGNVLLVDTSKLNQAVHHW